MQYTHTLTVTPCRGLSEIMIRLLHILTIYQDPTILLSHNNIIILPSHNNIIILQSHNNIRSNVATYMKLRGKLHSKWQGI